MIFFVITDPETGAEQIIAKYKDGMLKLSRFILKDYHLAEDVVQDALLQLIQNLGKIDDLKSIEARNYIFSVTKHTALNELKKSKRKFREVVGESEAEDGSYNLVIEPAVDFKAFEDQYGFGEEAEELFQHLNETDREILRLKIGAGFNNEEVGRILGMEKRSVETRYYRLKQRLIRILKEKDGITGEEVTSDEL